MSTPPLPTPQKFLPADEDKLLKKNNFDLLRLLFAGTVCLVHTSELSGFKQLQGIASLLSSAVAVKAFFVVSGFLIFMSFERSSSLVSFARKRIRRIYPGYLIVILLSAFGLMALSFSQPTDYFSRAWWRYLSANLIFLNFLQPTLPGVFTSNLMPAVNGALWTLKVEVLFYCAVPAIVWLLRRTSPFLMLSFMYVASVMYVIVLTRAASHTGSAIYLELARQLPGQLCYFVAGAFFYYFLSFFQHWKFRFLALAVLAFAVNYWYPLVLVEPFALATVVIFFGLFCYLGNFGKYGDFSYGVYILHFPIIQLLLQSGWFSENPWYFLLAVITLTVVGAIALWHLVEKHFLLRKH